MDSVAVDGVGVVGIIVVEVLFEVRGKPKPFAVAVRRGECGEPRGARYQPVSLAAPLQALAERFALAADAHTRPWNKVKYY